jgi:hypothetical protein
VSDRELHRVLASYHQFLIANAGSTPIAESRLPEDESLVHGGDGQLVVRTGAYAAPIEVLIERINSEPSALDVEWEDVVELSVRCSAGLEVAELMGAPRAQVVSQPGWYRLRIGARGRDAGDQRGEVGSRATILERFVIQAWPAPASDGTTIKATSLQPVDHQADRVHLAAAREAAQRITADLAGEAGRRTLSGVTGAIDVSWVYPATRRKLFRAVVFPNLWTSASSNHTGMRPERGVSYRLSSNEYRDIWDGIPTGPDKVWVKATLVEVDSPTGVVTRWEWVTGPDYGHGEPILTTTLSVRLDQATDGDGTPLTTVHLRHDQLPTEWLDDMRRCWLCKLEAGEKVFALAR